MDQSGAVIAGARVTLTGEDRSINHEVVSGADGQFSFAGIAPGPFQLTITSAGFATQTYTGVLHSGEIDTRPPIVLTVASNVTEVQVGVNPVEVAEEQIKIEEKQRVLGVLPNFYVSYIPNAAPLNSKQKFKLAWKTVTDPFTLVFVGGAAGVEQAQNHFREYGQGAQGYAKRFGAGYGDTLTGTFIGSAILPALLKQDPRYFYKGTGRMTSRAPIRDREFGDLQGRQSALAAELFQHSGQPGVGRYFESLLSTPGSRWRGINFRKCSHRIGGTAVTNLLQEFVIRKLTPKLPNHDQAKP